MSLTDRQQQAANILFKVLGDAERPLRVWKYLVEKYFNEDQVAEVLYLGTDPTGADKLEAIAQRAHRQGPSPSSSSPKPAAPAEAEPTTPDPDEDLVDSQAGPEEAQSSAEADAAGEDEPPT